VSSQGIMKEEDSYHNGELEKRNIYEEIALPGKPWRVLFQVASVCPEQKRVEHHSKLWSSQQKACHQPPDLRWEFLVDPWSEEEDVLGRKQTAVDSS